jgi:hypothetical protein
MAVGGCFWCDTGRCVRNARDAAILRGNDELIYCADIRKQATAVTARGGDRKSDRCKKFSRRKEAFSSIHSNGIAIA